MEADCGGEEGFLATPEKRGTGDCRLQSAAKRPRIAGSADHDNEGQGALCDWWPILAQRMGPGVLTILKEVFSQGFCLSTDYSGFGFFEVALAKLAESLGADTSAVTCYRASDINVTCRRALLSREGPGRPEHVFGDILGRYAHQVRRSLTAVHDYWLQQLEVHVSQDKVPRAQAVKDLGELFIQQMCIVLDAATPEATLYCYCCRRQCQLLPSSTDTGSRIRIHAAGSTCVDCSQMGSRNMLMGKSSIPFVIWAQERKTHQEDIIFHECVPGHTSEDLLQCFLGTSHHIINTTFCPSDLGWPMTRKRSYTICVSKAMVSDFTWMLPPVTLAGYGLGRMLKDNGEHYFCCTGEILREAFDKEAQKMRSKGENPFVWRDLLSDGDLRRLEEYEAVIASSGDQKGTGDIGHIFDVRQAVAHMGSPRQLLPCLLRRSRMWSHRHQRFLIGQEAMRAMGWPSDEKSLEMLKGFTDAELMSAASNAMHIPAVTVCLIDLIRVLARESRRPAHSAEQARPIPTSA